MREVAEPIIGGDPTSSPTAQKRAAAMVGRVVSDRYRIIELVAMGGMGAIFRGEHLLMRKLVAIKVLHPEIEGFPELVARFEREAVAGAHIQHPNVASASDFGKFDGDSCFLVLEYLKGTTLRDLLKNGPIDPDRAATFAKQIASALGAVHEKGIVHRDLKPLNIMVLNAGNDDPTTTLGREHVKLIDFGLAKVPVDQLSELARDADPLRRSLTAAGVVMGTVAYIAPESALGMRSVGPRSDLYSLGVVFYEMLAGRHPFDGDDAKTLFTAHRSKTPPPISERSPEVKVPPELEKIVLKLLEKDPENRYPNAEAVVAAIDKALAPPRSVRTKSSPPRTEHTPVVVAPRLSQAPSKAPIWIGVGIAAAAVLAAGLFMVLRSDSKEETKQDTSATTTPTAPAAATTGRDAPPVVAKTARETLRAAIDSADAKKAHAVLKDLIDTDPEAFKDRAVQTDAAEAAQLAAGLEGALTDELFNRLATKLGTDGLDVLYDLVAREGPKSDTAQRVGLTAPKSAPARARNLLLRPDLIGKASPAMRIAFDLHKTPCSTRPVLFQRASKDGDDRALQILQSMQPPACTPGPRACCFPQHQQLDRTISDIQARLRR